MDVAAWLDARGVGQYADAFAENHIDADTLKDLTAALQQSKAVRGALAQSPGPNRLLTRERAGPGRRQAQGRALVPLA